MRPIQQRQLKDIAAGLVVFFVALPLCLGLAHVSGAPSYLAGVLSGVIGGIVAGYFSSSHTSVSGISPGLVAVVVIQLKVLGSYEAFLLAVVVAGCLQMLMGAMQVGRLTNFLPTSVIRGLLAAVGLILILKQVPHLLGHDINPEGVMAFRQADQANTFTELLSLTKGTVHWGAMTIGFVSLLLLVMWHRTALLKQSRFPAQLAAVLIGIILVQVFRYLGGVWLLQDNHLVHVPVHNSLADFFQQLHFPDLSRWRDGAVYQAGAIIAVAASLETLVNLDAADQLDPEHRHSSPSHELWAQGIANICSGCVGALPITSSVVRSSVNIQAGAATKWAAIFHGVLLLLSVLIFPWFINSIPLSAIAAILLSTGWTLVNPRVVTEKWKKGLPYFTPFIVTVLAILFTDLLLGTLVGLAISLVIVLYSKSIQSIKCVAEKHLSGEVIRIELPTQLSFLDARSLRQTLHNVPSNSDLLLDARGSNYLDPDVIQILQDFEKRIAPTRAIRVSHLGFGKHSGMQDRVLFVDHCSREVQTELTPAKALQALRDGNLRFQNGQSLTRDAARARDATAEGQHPMAVLLSCIDSRAPTELVFDLGLGDVFGIRVAGNVSSPKVLGSMEFSCAVAGAKLILVMGHTRCGAVTEAVQRLINEQPSPSTVDCHHLESIVSEIQNAVDQRLLAQLKSATPTELPMLVDRVARRNVALVMDSILDQSRILRGLTEVGRLAVVGAIYDVSTGSIELFPHLLTQFDLAEPKVSVPN